MTGLDNRQLFTLPELAQQAEDQAATRRATAAQAAAERAAKRRRDQLGQWMTPSSLAQRMVRSALRFAAPLAQSRSLRVLEPACGDGALVHPLALQRVSITAIDIDPEMVRATQSRVLATCAACGAESPICNAAQSRCCPACACCLEPDLALFTGDFRLYAEGYTGSPYDLVVMNPPFHQINEFVESACAVSRAVVLLGPTGMQHGDSHARLHAALRIKHVRVLLKRPRFSGSTGQPRQDHVVLLGVPQTASTRERKSHRITYGVWPDRWV